MDYSFGYWPVRDHEVGPLSANYVSQQHRLAYTRTEPLSPATLAPRKKTLDPYVTGTSVVGIVYKDGVMLAADTLASYGSLARFRCIQRIHKIGDKTLIGFSGELSDWDHIHENLERLVNKERCLDDGYTMGAVEFHAYLSRIMYARRNKFDPLWNQLLVAGFDNSGKPYLGYVDLVGTTYTDTTLATGYGAYLARPLLRKEHRVDMTEEEARKLLEDCLRVLWYRDARAWDTIQIGKVTKEGIEISEPYRLDTDWSIGYRARE